MNESLQKKRLLKIRTEGAAMVYAVFVMAILTGLCALIIGLNYYRNFANRDTLKRLIGMMNAENGLQLLLNEPSMFPYDTSIRMSLFGNRDDSVVIRHEQWGVFDLMIAASVSQRDTIAGMVLTGNISARDKPAALYLAPSVIPLTCAGTTFIRGKALIPDGIINTATINGRNFDGSVTGCEAQNSTNMIVPDAGWERIKTENVLAKLLQMHTIPYMPQHIKNTTNPFDHSALILLNKQDIVIENVCLKGRIAVASSRKIIVKHSASLEDVLLIAPVILIEQGFKGSLQALAMDSIITGEDCELRYPSVLSVYVTDQQDRPSKIMLQKGGVLNGIALCISERSRQDHSCMIVLKPGSIVNGQVICNDMVQAGGRINGSLITKSILLITKAGTYENTLMDAVIDGDALPSAYTGIDIYNNTQTQQIVKCLH